MSLVKDVVFVLDINGKRKELHYRKLPFAVWAELKRELGFTPSTLISALGDSDVEALGAVVWLERRQTDRQLTWRTVRRELEQTECDVELVGLKVDGEILLDDEAEDEPEVEVELDPTSAV